MGYARFDDTTYRAYTDSIRDSSAAEIFSRRTIAPTLDPGNITVREARDSEYNPKSTPVLLFSDVTGSMGILAETMIRQGLGKIMTELYDHEPITDPQILCGAIGDSTCDRYPLQVTQFEAGVQPLVSQLADIVIEKGGGGNPGESYALAWQFAADKTKSDAWDKRKQKGYLFTIGDECCLSREGQKSAGDLLRTAQERYHVYHLIVKPVGSQPVLNSWDALLGDRAVFVKDIATLPDVIANLIRVREGQAEAARALGKHARPAAAAAR
jgi:hypothetical protein